MKRNSEDEYNKKEKVIDNLKLLIGKEIEEKEFYIDIICCFENIYDDEHIIVDEVDGIFQAYADTENSKIIIIEAEEIEVEEDEKIYKIKEVR